MKNAVDIQLVTEPGADLSSLITLFREYQMGLGEDLCFQGFEAEMQDPLKKYTQAGGVLLLAKLEGHPVGCVAFQRVPPAGTCEMKRLYVRASARRRGIGELLVTRVLEAAKERGLTTMVLDTLDRLEPAIRLYERFGFEHTTAYYENPLPGVVYMKKTL